MEILQPIHNFSEKKGFTILEAIAAVAICVIGMLASYIVIGQINFYVKHTNTKLTASYLAKEGIEMVRAMRDTNYEQSVGYDTNLTDGNYEVDYTQDSLTACSSSCAFSNLRYLNNSGSFYKYASGIPSIFKRKVSISHGSGYIKVVSTVYWIEKNITYQVGVEENLYDWLLLTPPPPQATIQKIEVSTMGNWLGPLLETGMGGGRIEQVGQTFLIPGSNFTPTKISLAISKGIGVVGGNLVVEIRNVIAGTPEATVLCSGSISAVSLSTYTGGTTSKFWSGDISLISCPALNSAIPYAFVVRYVPTTGDPNDVMYFWRQDVEDDYTDGDGVINMVPSGWSIAWELAPSDAWYDMNFKLYGVGLL